MDFSLDRREFIGSAAAAGALIIGFPSQASAQGLTPKINA